MTGLKPATSCSQSKHSFHWATSRYICPKCQRTNFFCVSKGIQTLIVWSVAKCSIRWTMETYLKKKNPIQVSLNWVLHISFYNLSYIIIMFLVIRLHVPNPVPRPPWGSCVGCKCAICNLTVVIILIFTCFVIFIYLIRKVVFFHFFWLWYKGNTNFPNYQMFSIYFHLF